MGSDSAGREGSDRVEAALAVAARAERRALGTGGERETAYETSGDVAWAPATMGLLRTLVLPDAALAGPLEAERTVRSGARSAFVRLGKYATAGAVKLRTYVLHSDRWLSLKVWGDAPEVAGKARREREARQAIAGIPGYAAPPVLAAGSGRHFHYLLEEAVEGTHPVAPDERQEAALAVIPGLLDAYRSSGLERRRLHDVVRPEFGPGIAGLLEDRTLPWPPAASPRRIAATLRRLVDDDLPLPCALGHGDLHVNNIVRTPAGGYWIVDWENAGVRPVAFDLRRLLSALRDPAEVQRELAADLRPFDSSHGGGYRWSEQLALAMCNELVLTGARRERARRRGELERFEALLADALAWLLELLD